MPALTNKKTILTFIGHYLPSYKSGGAMRLLSNLVNFLSNSYEFKIITRDRDFLDSNPYPNIKVNEWNTVSNTPVFYTDFKTSIRRLLNNTSFDMYYLNSLYDYHFSIKVILLRKLRLIPKKDVVLAPQGELMEGAISVKKIKKRTFITISKLLGLYNDITWHAGSDFEADDIRREYGIKAKIKVAQNIPDFNLPKAERTLKKEKGKLKILFISVISPKKNLLFVIDVLNKVKGDFTLDIYGPIKDQHYWELCQKQISEKIRDKISYKGPISYDKMSDVYPMYDVFFFPTLGESFGHVIYEALAYGCPVLCSDKTPWNELEKFNAGINVNLNEPERFGKIISEYISLTNQEYQKYIVGCKNYIEHLLNIEFHLDYTSNLFKLDSR